MDSDVRQELPVSLPSEFADLERWVHEWALLTEQQRFDKRVGSTLDQLRPFYDAMLARMPAIMEYLARLPVEGLAQADERLLRLALSYVEISRCFEAWGQVDVRADFFKPEYLHSDG
jgi:hypothetical protein